jgi:hypothetical protein
MTPVPLTPSIAPTISPALVSIAPGPMISTAVPAEMSLPVACTLPVSPAGGPRVCGTITLPEISNGAETADDTLATKAEVPSRTARP